jgi:hypothetical protein
VTLRLSRPAILGLSAVVLALSIIAIAVAIAPAPAACEGLCQCWLRSVPALSLDRRQRGL